MMKFSIDDKVQVHNTNSVLDGHKAVVKGYHMDYMIILFDTKPDNYEQAIVLNPHCLKLVE